MEFISGSGKAFNTIHANNYTFYEHLNEVIQKEPLRNARSGDPGPFCLDRHRERASPSPDARMKKILTDAVAIANAAARSIVWHPRVDGTMKGHRDLSRYPQRLADGLGGQERVLQWQGRQDHEL